MCLGHLLTKYKLFVLLFVFHFMLYWSQLYAAASHTRLITWLQKCEELKILTFWGLKSWFN